MSHNNIESPIPLADIESVLEWVDTFKLSRITKKINRDFSDAVLLAEILSVYYPKLVEMHNYPPRNSHSLKLNNWMTLNRKVLKKLKLNLCCDTMEQLANCAPGVIERVLVMVREKIRRDEEANKSLKEESALMSSGGSYYEACGDDEHVLVVPVKLRVNGVLETIQQKVISYESYLSLKEELKDIKDAAEVLKQKVDHLDSMLKIKNERIDELQNQLERKQARRKEVEALQNNLSVPFETVASPHITSECLPGKLPSLTVLKQVDSKTKAEESKTKLDEIKIKLADSKSRFEESRIPIPKELARSNKPNLNDINTIADPDTVEMNGNLYVNKSKSDDKMLKDKVSIGQSESSGDFEEFKDSEAGAVITIEETIQKEAKDLITVDIVQE